MENIIDNIFASMRLSDEDINFLQRVRRELLLEYRPGQRQVPIGGAGPAVVARLCQDIAQAHVRVWQQGDLLLMEV